MSTSAGRCGRYLLLYGSALLLAVVVGAVVPYSERLGGDNGPYMLLGILLSIAAAGAILLQWRIGVFLLAAALPFESTVNFGAIASGIKALALLTFVSFALALLTDRRLFERFAGLWQQPLTLAVFAFVLWILASNLWAIDKGKVSGAAVTFVGLFGLMVVTGSLERRNLVLAWACLAFSAALSVPAGYILPLPEGSDMATSGRFGPGGAGPNTYSCLMAIAFFVAYFGLLRQHRMFAYLLAPVFLYGIIATGSRTGLIALAATPLLALVVPGLVARLGWRILSLYGLAATALVVIALAVPSVNETALERYTTLSQVESEATWNGRWSLWQGALDVFTSNPILGVGAGNYAEAARNYSESSQAHIESKGQVSGVAHNIFFGVASQLGLVGLILFLVVLFLAFKTAVPVALRSGLGTGILLGLIVFMIAGMTLSWESQKIVYVLFGSVLALQLHDLAQGASSPSSMRAHAATDVAPSSRPRWRGQASGV